MWLSMKKDIYSEDKLNIQIEIFKKNKKDLFNGHNMVNNKLCFYLKL